MATLIPAAILARNFPSQTLGGALGDPLLIYFDYSFIFSDFTFLPQVFHSFLLSRFITSMFVKYCQVQSCDLFFSCES